MKQIILMDSSRLTELEQNVKRLQDEVEALREGTSSLLAALVLVLTPEQKGELAQFLPGIKFTKN